MIQGNENDKNCLMRKMGNQEMRNKRRKEVKETREKLGYAAEGDKENYA